MYLKYNKDQRLPVNPSESETPCEAIVMDAMYKIKVTRGNGMTSELLVTESELKAMVVGNPQPCSDGKYYQPTCPYGYDDCVCDPAYTKAYHPEWCEQQDDDDDGVTSCEVCEDGDRYDDEDK